MLLEFLFLNYAIALSLGQVLVFAFIAEVYYWMKRPDEVTTPFYLDGKTPTTEVTWNRPKMHFAQCHRHGVSYINCKAENFLSTAAIFWIKELQFHIPAITIKSAKRAFFYFDIVQLHPSGNRISKRRSSFLSISCCKNKGAIVSSLPQGTQIEINAVQ